MLQEIRDKSSGLIAGILIGFLVIIFALFGTDQLWKNYVAKSKSITVNGESFSEQDIERAISRQRQQIMNRYGESVPADMIKDEVLRDPAINTLIQRALLEQAATKDGLVADSTTVNEQILNAFKKDGQFDAARFEQVARSQGYTIKAFRKVIATDLAVSQLQSAIGSSGFATATETNLLMGLAFQTRTFSYVVIPAEKVEKQVVIDEKELKTYYDANPKTYTTPEQVAVDYLDLNLTDLMQEIKVTDDQVVKQYEQNLKSYVVKTERQAAHILLPTSDEKLIAEVKAKLAAGEDFAALAKKYSTDAGSKEQGGDLGFTAGDVFPPEFETALGKLKVGEVSAPIKSEAGVSIIKLLAERGGKPPSLEEAKPAIIEQLKRAEAESQFVTKRDKLKELSFNADKLAEVGKELGLPVKNTGLFSRTAGKDVAANKSFADAAFSPDVLEQGNSSELIDFDKDRTLVLKKTDHKLAELQKYEVVKEQVTQVVRAEKIQSLLAQQAKDLIAAISAGASLSDQAKSIGVEVKSLTNSSRNDPQVPRDIGQFAFSMAQPSGKPYAASTRTDNGEYAVVFLSEVTMASDDKIPQEQRAAVNNQLASMQGDAEFKAYAQFLEDNAKIKRK